MKVKDVFLDGASTSPLDKRVLKAMKPYLSQKFVGNSSSIHDFGIRSSIAIEESRFTIAKALGVKSEEVLFTSGATESNNWVIKSLGIRALSESPDHTGHIICSATEHSSVIHACRELEKLGISVTYLRGSGIDGAITRKDVRRVARSDTFLICVMALNNETGVKNDVEDVAKYARAHKICTLVDCTQWLSYGGDTLNIASIFPHGDYFSFSGHKIYGPTGVGCLIARTDVKKYLTPLISGGSQEGGLRGGTSNTAGIVGLAKSIELLRKTDLSEQYEFLYNYLLDSLGSGVSLNATPYHTNIINLNFSKIFNYDNLAAVLATYGIAVSAGSACDAEHNETLGDFHPSHVLSSLGFHEREIRNSVRVSFTKFTSIRDIDRFIKVICLLKQQNLEKETSYERD